VDYLGLVQNTNNKLESHVLRQANITEQLAALAIELDCIVIALSQVNREYANRQDKCPVTSDAADSSGSERSSTVWLGVHRPYADDEVSGTENHFVVKCRKNRFGPLWKAVFDFQDGVFRETDQARAFSYYSGLGAMTMKGMKNYKEYADRKG
jgi:replicative DNA helicase